MQFLANLYPIRFVISVVSCALVICSIAQPAMAFGEPQSRPSDGVTSLNKIEQKSKEVLRSGPRSEEEMKTQAPGGLNGVQGTADREKMISPEDARNVKTPTDRIENFLEKNL